MIDRLSRITWPRASFSSNFYKLAQHHDNRHFSARRIGGRMLAMCGLSAMHLTGTGGVAAEIIAETVKNITYYPLAIWGLIIRPYRLATAIGLTVSFPFLADNLLNYLPDVFHPYFPVTMASEQIDGETYFLGQYHFIQFIPAFLISSGLETARVIWGKICPKNIHKLEQEFFLQLCNYANTSEDIAKKLVSLPLRKGNLIFAKAVIQSLLQAENMSWKAGLILDQLDELAKSSHARTARRAKRLVQYLKYLKNSEIFRLD